MACIVINAKTYSEATGPAAVRLGKACDAVIRKTGADITLALQPFDLVPVQNATRYVKIASQHLDACTPGRNTGFLVPANVRSLGVTWTLLNHSEHKLPPKILATTVAEAQRAGLGIILCADTPAEARRVAALRPDFIALESPELIGGDLSVSTARPDVITRGLRAVDRIPLLVGAGIKTGADVKKAMELGAKGVLVASGVVLAKSPQKVLEEFAKASRP